MAVQLISIKEVMDNLLDNPLLENISFDRVVNHTVDFMKLVGCPAVFSEKIAEIEIKDHRGVLPCDFISINQVKSKSGKMYISSSDSFHFDDNSTKEAFTYKLQNSVIFTAKKEDVITISYKAIEIDAKGYPLIPDNVSLKLALEEYIKMKFYKNKVEAGKMNPQIYSLVQQEYAWRVGQAQTSLRKLSIDEMQGLTNMWTSLFANTTEHDSGFKTIGSREYMRKH